MTNTDLLTIGYNVTGKMFRDSLQGKLFKLAITNNLTKRVRDKLLDKFKTPEDYKRYAQYLTGGQVNDKIVTELPANVKQEVIDAHHENLYPHETSRRYLPKTLLMLVKKATLTQNITQTVIY